MATFDSAGFSIAYDDIGTGEGRPMFLVHGFSSNRNENWRRLGWYGAFERKRIRMVAADTRGHGESAKPRDPAAYSRAALAGDVLALADQLGIERFHLMGYSMGSRIALEVALARIDQRIERGAVDSGGAHRLAERTGNLMRDILPRLELVERVAPPLQPHLPDQRFAHHLTDLGQLDIEGIEREQMLAHRRRRENHGQEAIVIVQAHLLGAVGQACHDCGFNGSPASKLLISPDGWPTIHA